MRRSWIIVGLIVSSVAGAAAYKRASNWKEFHYFGTAAMVDLAHPDAVIRTASLSQLPHDLLKVPIARDVLTEDLVFYYEQHEDRQGLSGALKRVAYEHRLSWSDQLLAKLLDQPAEVALWRDGKGALRHYVVAVQRSALSKVLQEAATVALKDQQLSWAGEIETASGRAPVLVLTVSPRRKFLLVGYGDTLLLLSDPGLVYAADGKFSPAALQVLRAWLDKSRSLTEGFSLGARSAQSKHTLAVNAATLALGYGDFFPGFKGLRFDYDQGWSTSIRLDPGVSPGGRLGDAALWLAAPVNPAACAQLPVDWALAQRMVLEAERRPAILDTKVMAALAGPAMVCWYKESSLYSPLLIATLAQSSQRDATLRALARWAFGAQAPDKKTADGAVHWRNPGNGVTLAARGDHVLFSPDAKLVEKALDTLARSNPSVADQWPAADVVLATLTPRALASMAEREIRRVTTDQHLLQALNTHLPARLKALASYPPYRLELPGAAPPWVEWRPLRWRPLETAP